MLRIREFWVVASIAVIGALTLARVVQFFAMGWRWRISQQQIDGGFDRNTQRKEFWIVFCVFLVIIVAIIFLETRST